MHFEASLCDPDIERNHNNARKVTLLHELSRKVRKGLGFSLAVETCLLVRSTFERENPTSVDLFGFFLFCFFWGGGGGGRGEL